MNNNELIVVCTEIVMELYIVTSMRLFTSLYFYVMLHSRSCVILQRRHVLIYIEHSSKHLLHSPTALSYLSIDTS